jgi:glycosyltransferase involved in cell wall biosynthesis
MLDDINPDVVVSIGYAQKAFRNAAAWAKSRGVLSILAFDTWGPSKHWWYPKEIAKWLLCPRLYDGVWVSGSRAHVYASTLGFSQDQIWHGYDCVDNLHFVRPASFYKQGDEQYFLTVSRLSTEKNIKTLIKAYERYSGKGGRWLLKIVGTGPQEERLRDAVDRHGLSEKVHFLGWLDYHELPRVYWDASVFILASRSDSWGLSVNEAMAAGLPLLISTACGCMPDLCKSGINGYVFDPADYDSLSDLMRSCSDCTFDLKALGANSRAIIEPYSIDTWCSSLNDMVTSLSKRS